MNERRQYERIELSEDVRVRDASGREFGKVQQVSGGGMLVRTDSLPLAEELTPGKQLRITVVEPNKVASLTIEVVVRYRRDAQTIGLEFVHTKSASG